MAKRKTPGERVREWRHRHGVSIAALAAQIGDPGGQLQRWESGLRPTLPLRLKVALAERTGIALRKLGDPDEIDLAQRVVTLMARDAAA